MLTRSRFTKIVRISAGAVAALIVIGYAGYRSLPYVSGPSIRVYQPIDGSSVASTTVDVAGKVERVNSLTIDGNLTAVDEAGAFDTTLIVQPGVNLIQLHATDQFGRSTETVLRILGTQPLPHGRIGTSASSSLMK